MVDTKGLNAEMVRKGITQEQLAKQLNISSRTFSNRMSKWFFGSDEIEKLVKILDIKDPMSVFAQLIIQ